MSKTIHGIMTKHPDTRIQRKDDRHLSNPVGEEMVLLNLETGDYLGLNRVAARIWTLLEHPITLAELENKLLSAFQIDEHTCREETLNFLSRISELGLLLRTDSSET